MLYLEKSLSMRRVPRVPAKSPVCWLVVEKRGGGSVN